MFGQASAMTLDAYSGLFADDLNGLADRLDEAHVRSVRSQADAPTISKKPTVSEIRSAAAESD